VYQQPLPLRQRGTALQRRSTCPYAALTPRGKPLMVAGARASAHTFRLRAASTGLAGPRRRGPAHFDLSFRDMRKKPLLVFAAPVACS
jgi:hypothetical protein